jgi:hypothetical protein
MDANHVSESNDIFEICLKHQIDKNIYDLIFADSDSTYLTKPCYNESSDLEKKYIFATLISEDDEFKFVNKRKPKTIRNRKLAWEFIMSWTDELFYRQFRISRGDFFIICDKIKNIYPSHSENIHIGIESYIHSQKMGNISTPSSGPVTLEIKLAITLRMLAGASALDMIWYGVQLATIPSIFQFIIQCLDTVLLNKDIYNFHPDNDNFIEEVNHIASNWSSIILKKKDTNILIT